MTPMNMNDTPERMSPVASSVSDTPRTDEVLRNYDAARAIMLESLAKGLERELAEVKAALSGRTVSCSTCNSLTTAIINIYRWTGSRRVARECKRVLPHVAALASQNSQFNQPELH
jgi:hypothetical protein